MNRLSDERRQELDCTIAAASIDPRLLSASRPSRADTITKLAYLSLGYNPELFDCFPALNSEDEQIIITELRYVMGGIRDVTIRRSARAKAQVENMTSRVAPNYLGYLVKDWIGYNIWKWVNK